jgi:hypothetical protein
LKCDKRIPPDSGVSLQSERAKLLKEVTERKVQREIPMLFADLRKEAAPRLLIKDPNRPVDLTAEVNHDINGGSAVPQKQKGRTPAGN